MNVSQYKINEKLTRDALVSLLCLPSVEESIRGGAGQQMGGRSSDGASAGDVPASASGGADDAFRTMTVDGVECEYALTTQGSARIVRCETDARNLVLPDSIEHAPVTAIAPHALCTCYHLEEVGLPAHLESIGEYAFMNTALRAVELPDAMRHIGRNAFYKCERLERIVLNDGLRTISESAFRESALSRLDIPASVEAIGQNAFRDTSLVFSGPGQTVFIVPGNARFRLVGGVLYELCEDGTRIVQVLDAEMREYGAPDCGLEGWPGLRAAAPKAFAGLPHLKRAELPDGVEWVGDDAFKGCIRLEHVGLPDTVRHIGRLAFASTALRALRIPAALTSVGTAAFYTGGSVARNFTRTIARVQIAPGNEAFYLEDGILCKRRDDVGDIALLYVGEDACVTIPRRVTVIGQYAFLNAANVRELHIHDGIVAIDVGGFDFGRAVPTVVYDVSAGGRYAAGRYVIAYPPGQAGRQAARQAFSRGYFDMRYAYDGADNALLITQDLFSRGKMMLQRLRHPVMLDERMRASFVRDISRKLPLIVVAFGRNGFPEGIDWLHEAGMLSADTVDQAIEAASDAGEIAVLSRLVELKRTAFAAQMFDFEL